MFREYVSVLNIDTSTTNVEFYSLSNSFCFINLCYTERKIYLFFWRPAILRFFPKKSRPLGDAWLLKLRTLKVKVKKEKTKFCRMYRMPKVLPNDAFWKTGNFLYKGLF